MKDHPTWAPVVAPLFAAIDAGEVTAVASELTLMEVLIRPLQLGDAALAMRYEELLGNGRGLRLIPISRGILAVAAQIRAATRVRTPDAIQLATALSAGATAFVTNDRALPRLPSLDLVQLSHG
jgi:predicted nucleic acid-binding protein